MKKVYIRENASIFGFCRVSDTKSQSVNNDKDRPQKGGLIIAKSKCTYASFFLKLTNAAAAARESVAKTATDAVEPVWGISVAGVVVRALPL